MKKLTKYLLLLQLLFFLSCEKNALFDCFHGTGEIIVDKRNITGFCIFLKVEGNANIYLVNSITPEISVEAGEFLQDKIITEMSNDSLYIRNENRCNWVRDYSKPVNIYVPS
jgi:hypothetical protein